MAWNPDERASINVELQGNLTHFKGLKENIANAMLGVIYSIQYLEIKLLRILSSEVDGVNAELIEGIIAKELADKLPHENLKEKLADLTNNLTSEKERKKLGCLLWMQALLHKVQGNIKSADFMLAAAELNFGPAIYEIKIKNLDPVNKLLEDPSSFIMAVKNGSRVAAQIALKNLHELQNEKYDVFLEFCKKNRKSSLFPDLSYLSYVLFRIMKNELTEEYQKALKIYVAVPVRLTESYGSLTKQQLQCLYYREIVLDRIESIYFRSGMMKRLSYMFKTLGQSNENKAGALIDLLIGHNHAQTLKEILEADDLIDQQEKDFYLQKIMKALPKEGSEKQSAKTETEDSDEEQQPFNKGF